LKYKALIIEFIVEELLLIDSLNVIALICQSINGAKMHFVILTISLMIIRVISFELIIKVENFCLFFI
jgi:hypothetical protein